MSDLLVARTTDRCGWLGSKPKFIAAHLACRRMGAGGRDGFATASAIAKRCERA